MTALHRLASPEPAAPSLGLVAPSSADAPAMEDAAEDPRVVEALEEYVLAVESGEPPDRAAFLDRHAAVAGALLPALEGVDFLHGATAASAPRSTPAAVVAGAVDGELGDFRIVRELGRGGMGVVYEAIQVSLGRRVALKVLPSGATLDRRLRMRFRTEVLAAAHLDHANIVPVYAVGTDRGVPYYAMRYIDGESLQAIIHALRDRPEAGVAADPGEPPRPMGVGEAGSRRAPSAARRVEPGHPPAMYAVRIGQQAALALEHAHGLGVLHRDIKPGNLLIDEQGDLWVTDFGLARIQGDAGLTISGDLVGTLRYMSPEQALGRSAEIDGRTDVYALGATLYELLTLKPLFHDREGPDLLRAIAQDEPQAPRRLDPDLPVDLETIILKAIAKAPGSRYATARELADDLGRFLRDEPILARRPTRAERVRRWLVRHRAAALGVLVSALAVLALALTASWRLKEQQERADLVRLRQEGRLKQAETAVQFALRAWEQLFDLDPQRRPEAALQAGAAGDRLGMLQHALGVFERFDRRDELPPEVRLSVAEAYELSGDAHAQHGRVRPAEADYRRAVALLEQLTQEDQSARDYQAALSASLNNLGSLLKEAGRLSESEAVLRRSLLIHEGLVNRTAARREDRRQLAIRLNNLGAVLVARGKRDGAALAWQRALALRQGLLSGAPDDPATRRDVAVSYANLGGLELVARRPEAAEGHFRKAVASLEKLTRAHGEVDDRVLLGRCYQDLGLAVAARGSCFEAEALSRKALDLQQALVAEFPDEPQLREDLARSYCSLGNALTATDRPTDGEEAFQEARALREALVAAAPEMPQYRDGLARVHLELAQLLRVRGRHGEAIDAYRHAWEHRPDDPVTNNDLAWGLALFPGRSRAEVTDSVRFARRAVASHPKVGAFWNTLGLARYRAGDWEGSAEATLRSMELRAGGDGFDWFLLALTYQRMGDEDGARQWFDLADRWMREQAAEDADLKALRSEAERALSMGTARPARAHRRGASGAGDAAAPARPRPDDLALDVRRPLEQAQCRPGLGVGPTSIPSPILQRSSFSPIIEPRNWDS